MFSESDYFSPAPPPAPQFKPVSSLTWMSVLPASTFAHTVCSLHRSHPKSEPVTPLLKSFLCLSSSVEEKPHPHQVYWTLSYISPPLSPPSPPFSLARLSTVSQTPEAVSGPLYLMFFSARQHFIQMSTKVIPSLPSSVLKYQFITEALWSFKKWQTPVTLHESGVASCFVLYYNPSPQNSAW